PGGPLHKGERREASFLHPGSAMAGESRTCLGVSAALTGVHDRTIRRFADVSGTVSAYNQARNVLLWTLPPRLAGIWGRTGRRICRAERLLRKPPVSRSSVSTSPFSSQPSSSAI